MYIAEISPARLRGMLGSVNQLAVTLGLLLSYVVGAFLHWKWLALVGGIPAALLVILMYTMPETPRWSLGNNRRSEALKSLLWLRGPEVDIDDECFRIEATLGKRIDQCGPLLTDNLGFINVVKCSKILSRQG